MAADLWKSKVRTLLGKINNIDLDKDEHYMATSDLVNELESFEGKIDPALQTAIRDAVLHQLDDPSNDVQTIAVSCLSTAVRKFEESKVIEIVDKLGNLLLSGKEELRDIYTTGVKAIITAVPKECGPNIATKLSSLLMSGLTRQLPDEQLFLIQMVCLDVLKDLLQRFGQQMAADHDNLLQVMTPLLDSRRVDLRKRVSNTLGPLVCCTGDRSFKGLMELVISKIETSSSRNETLYTYIQTIGVISRNAGVRVGRYLPHIVPVLKKFCPVPNDGDHSDAVKELRENCLQAFESILLRCPNEVTPYINDILNISIHYMCLDPNYTYDDDNAEVKDADGWDDDGDWDKDIAEYNEEEDDDDTSWKVRRAAVKCISAFVRAKGDILRDYYDDLCGQLVARFKERVANVKLEIFRAFNDLLRAAVVTRQPAAGAIDAPVGRPQLVRTRSSHVVLSHKIDQIVTELNKHYRNSDLKAKVAIWSVFRELLVVMQGNLGSHLRALIPNLVEAISDRDTGLRTGALAVLRLVVELHTGFEIQPFISTLTPQVVAAARDVYTKIKSEGLRLCGSLAQSMRSAGAHDRAVLGQLYQAVHSQLILQDVEQEVKEAAILSMAAILSSFGDSLANELQQSLTVILSRLNNEVTRHPALRAITQLANSQLGLNLSAPLTSAIRDLCSFMRKHSQSLKHETVVTLEAVVRHVGANLPEDLCSLLLLEVAPHIKDDDLHLSQLVLELLSSVIQACPAAMPIFARDVYPRVLAFLRSPLLQGQVLTSLMKLFQTMLFASYPELNYAAIMQSLMRSVTPDLPKQSFSAFAQCVATVATSAPLEVTNQTVAEFLNAIQGNTAYTTRMALMSIGEIGRQIDLSHHANIENTIFACFGDASDDVKTAASFALGNMAVGNLDRYLPVIFDLLASQPQGQYLLLSSLKEIISRHSVDESTMGVLRSRVTSMAPVLFGHADSKDEGVRSMVAECVGKLATIDSQSMFPEIELRCTSPSADTRATMAASIKFALSKNMHLVVFQQILPKFLNLLTDVDRNVKRQAFLTLNAIIHTHFDLVRSILDSSILPVVYQETVINRSLIREIDLGPFKHIVDDGFPLRKAAYQCMETLVDVASEILNIHEFVRHLQEGLNDDEKDIQLITYQIFYKIATWRGVQLLEVVEDLPPLLTKGITKKLKEAKENEPERAIDVLRSAVRALYSIRSIPGAEQCEKFCTFYSRVLQTAQLKEMISVILKEKESSS
eukprot:TRINITY_DN3053_c0_g2_i1.p1 TRINITY_DN3053_c0_g2~~TRINITY_DN3053_c0_g2_i1.p1  ORF type:complete len:1239 (+),score=571.04 TRINITY_DN3053_c0_g2_i1:71-3787(+)